MKISKIFLVLLLAISLMSGCNRRNEEADERAALSKATPPNSADTQAAAAQPTPTNPMQVRLAAIKPAILHDFDQVAPTIQSKTGQGPQFTVSNAAAVAGKTGQAFEFGRDRKSVVFADAALVSSLPKFTLAMWVKLAPSNDETIYAEASTKDFPPLFNIETKAAGDKLRIHVYARDASGRTLLDKISQRTIPTNAWSHLVLTRNGDTMRLYIDGELDGADFSYPPASLGANSSSIGALRRPNTIKFLDGIIDEFAVYDQPL